VHALPRELKVVFLLPVLGTLAGCAIGATGVITARHTRTPTATVVDLYSFGVQLRPSAFDGGVTLGYRHVTYIYPRAASTTAEAPARVQWLRCDVPAGPPILLASRSVGVELQATQRGSRLSLGYLSQTTVTSPVGPHESCLLQLDYEPAQPQNTVVALLTAADALQAP
jgi:hypothetical protein